MALALYRKYRPRSFAEMIGQEHVTDPLSQALRSGRLNHAYLFSGPRGCGKTSSARILARSLNCEAGPTPTPCDVCESCRGLAPDGGGTIDVIEIDAASHGGVDDARELRERAFFAPASSRFKIYIIDEAHMVSSAGFNALLKLVEEPPEYVKFVFATTEPEKVLGTIKSRTHHYPFRLIPPSVLRPYLEKLSDAEGVAVEQAVFPLVVRAGGGSVRDSLSVLDQLIAGAGDEGVTYARAVTLLGVTDVALIDEMVDGLAAGDGAAAFATIDALAEAGHDSRRFAADLLQRFRDLIILRQLPDAIEKGLLDAPEDELARMRIQAGQLGDATLSRCADIVHNGLVEMRGAASPRLLLELIVARMLLPAAEESISALLQRVERLESGFIPTTAGGSATARSAAPIADSPSTPAHGSASGAGGSGAGASGGGAFDGGTFGAGGSGSGSGGPGSDGGSSGGASSAQAAARAAASQAASRASAGSRGKPSTPASPSSPNSQKSAAGGGPADSTPGNGETGPSTSDGSPPSAAKAPAPEQPGGSYSAPAPSTGSDSGTAAASRGASQATSTSVAPRVQAAMSEEESWPVAATPGAASAAAANASASGAGAGAAAGSGASAATGPADGGAGSAGARGAGTAGSGPGGVGAAGSGASSASAGAGGVGAAAEAGAPVPRQASDSGVDAATVRRHWDEIVRMVGQGSKKAAAFAREAVVREVDGNKLILVFKHKIHADGVSNDPAPLREAVRQVIGGAWELRCEIGGDQRQSARTSAPAAAQKAPPQKAAPQKAQPASNPAPADDEVPYDPEFDGGFDPGDEPDVETDSLTVRQTSEEQALESLRKSFNLEKINETGR